MEISEIKEAIETKYAWPGGYPLVLIMNDGETMCMNCAEKEWQYIESALKENDKTCGWYVAGVDVNWEDVYLVCCNCGSRIASAYGEAV